MTLTDTDLHDAKNPEDWVCGQGMNDRELTQIVQNHTGYPWFNGKAYVEYHGIDVNQDRIAELEAALTWYGAQVYLFANDTTEKADEADVALDQDGGKRARAALGDGA
jgi:hypothetical protein